MKAKFKLISTLLIVLLTILLIAVMVNYLSKPIELNNEPVVNIANTNHNIEKVISENVGGETLTSASGDVSENMDSSFSGDKVGSGLPYGNSLDGNTSGKNNEDGESTVIITSEDTMTNKEKRQILTELDNTLMDLLDVVDKVQTVDETRLITSGSEVQE